MFEVFHCQKIQVLNVQGHTGRYSNCLYCNDSGDKSRDARVWSHAIVVLRDLLNQDITAMECSWCVVLPTLQDGIPVYFRRLHTSKTGLQEALFIHKVVNKYVQARWSALRLAVFRLTYYLLIAVKVDHIVGSRKKKKQPYNLCLQGIWDTVLR